MYNNIHCYTYVTHNIILRKHQSICEFNAMKIVEYALCTNVQKIKIHQKFINNMQTISKKKQ